MRLPAKYPLQGLHSLAIGPDDTDHHRVGWVFCAVNWRHLNHLEGKEPVCLAVLRLVDSEDSLVVEDLHSGAIVLQPRVELPATDQPLLLQSLREELTTTADKALHPQITHGIPDHALITAHVLCDGPH